MSVQTDMAAAGLKPFDPFDAEVMADPYPYFAWMRENDPVHYVESLGMPLITRAVDVEAALRDVGTFSSAGWMELMFGDYQVIPEVKFLLSLDPPDHTRLRRLVNTAFTRTMVANLETAMLRVVDEALTTLAESDAPDIVRDVAIPVPIKVIAAMTGVDPDMTDDFARWGATVVHAINVNISGQVPHADWDTEVADAIRNLRDYYFALIEDRRRNPRDDLATALVHASDDEDKLSELEVISVLNSSVNAGFETTGKLIGNLLLALFQHPDQLAALRADPSLIPAAVQEGLRYDSPALFLPRLLTRDHEVAGTPMDSGFCLVSYASANHDPAKFPDRPAAFDITRNTKGHVAFGLGPHFCLGAHLAPRETEVVLNGILRRFSHIEYDPAGVKRDPTFFLRGLASLPVSVRPA
jgi:cytochrome P450